MHIACLRVKPAGDFSWPAVLQMASAHTQGAKLRTPKGFNKLLAVNLGFGVDQHGQDATVSMDNTLTWLVVPYSMPMGSCRKQQ